MKRIAIFLASLLFTLPLFATAQAGDILKAGATTYEIHTNPLAPWLAANPGKLPAPEVVSTGLWRGYIATWSIRENRLFLDDVQMKTAAAMDPDAPEEKQWRSVVRALFGTTDAQPATWYTGNLIVPTGELVDYVHTGYASTFASYLIVTVVKGDVKQQRELDAKRFEAFRREQFAAYKKTKDYADHLAESMKGAGALSAKEAERFIFQYASAMYLSRIFEDGSLH